MTIDAYILYGFLAVALIVGIFTVIAIRKENTEKAERNARIAAANARYAAEKAARDALQVLQVGSPDFAAEMARIREEREINAEAAVLRQRMRNQGLTSLDAGDVLDTVERAMPIDEEDEKLRRRVEADRANRENFAAIDIATRPLYVVPMAPSAEHPKCQSSAYPSSPSCSDTPPSTSPDNSPPASTD